MQSICGARGPHFPNHAPGRPGSHGKLSQPCRIVSFLDENVEITPARHQANYQLKEAYSFDIRSHNLPPMGPFLYESRFSVVAVIRGKLYTKTEVEQKAKMASV